MVKSLKDVLQGVKSSKKVKNDLGGYKPKAGDEEKFAVKHEIEKHEDRVGNGDDVYNATNVKHSIEGEERHGYKKPKDEKVNEEKKTCNMTEAGQMCEVHGMADCGKGGKGKKVLKEKEPVSEEADYEYEMARNELATAERAVDRLMKHLKGEGSLEAWVQSKITKAADYLDSVADYMESNKVNEENIEEAWYSEKGGERTYHKGQRDAMRHARQIGGSYGADHGAQGQKASKALGWDAREKAGLGIGLKSKADKQKETQQKKAAKKAGPWGLREASVPATVGSKLPSVIAKLPAVKNKLPSTVKPGMSDKVKKTIGTGAVLGTAAGGYMSLPDDDDEDTNKKNSPSSAKKDDFPTAGRWRDEDDKKIDTNVDTAPKKYANDDIPVVTPKKEPDEPVFNPKNKESWWDRRARMKDEIEDAKHEMKLKKIKAGEKDDDDDEDTPHYGATGRIGGLTAKQRQKMYDSGTKVIPIDPKGDYSKPMGKITIADPVGMRTATSDSSGENRSPSKSIKNDFNRQAEMGPDDERRKPKKVNEALSKDAPAGEWIKDFVDSDNPKFAGKSKAKRKQMALAAYYAKQRNEEVEQIDELTKKTLGKYVQAAFGDAAEKKKAGDKKGLQKREDGINLAGDKAFGFAKVNAKGVKKIDEAVTTSNEGHGYHGEAWADAKGDDKMAEAGKAFAKAHSLVKQHAAEHLKNAKNPNQMVKHYLDSQHGRHLYGNENDASYVKKDFAHFAKKYKPEMHEELAVPLLGSVSGAKKKMKKEQTGPDTPLTLPNMSVDVNTGRNV